MVDTTKKKKPPTQIAGVTGIDSHKPMGSDPTPFIDWQKLINLPAFEMFVSEQTKQTTGSVNNEWIVNRRTAMGDEALYNLYSKWHSEKCYWPNETPMGDLIQEVE